MGLPVEPTGISLIWFIIFIFKIWADFVTTYGILLHCSGNLDFVSSAKFSSGMYTVQEKSFSAPELGTWAKVAMYRCITTKQFQFHRICRKTSRSETPVWNMMSNWIGLEGAAFQSRVPFDKMTQVQYSCNRVRRSCGPFLVGSGHMKFLPPLGSKFFPSSVLRSRSVFYRHWFRFFFLPAPALAPRKKYRRL